ncbi:hypothetical protein FRX31_006529, partial [Thalictrum thalictroides]
PKFDQTTIQPSQQCKIPSSQDPALVHIHPSVTAQSIPAVPTLVILCPNSAAGYIKDQTIENAEVTLAI